MYVPVVKEPKEQIGATVALAVRATLDGHVTVSPVEGLTIVLRATVPTKLNVLARMTVVDPDPPKLKLIELVTLMVKSPT